MRGARRWLDPFLDLRGLRPRSALDARGTPDAPHERGRRRRCSSARSQRERWTYACAKQLLERVIWAHGAHGGLTFTIVRPFNVIGPRMDFVPGVDGEGMPRVLASFMNALLRGEELPLVDGGRAAALVHLDVEDFVEAVVRIVERPDGVPAPDPEPRQPRQRRQHPRARARRCRARLRARACRARPRRASATSRPRSSTAPATTTRSERIPDIGKARRLLGWQPRETPRPRCCPGSSTTTWRATARAVVRRAARCRARRAAGADEPGRRHPGVRRRAAPRGRHRARRAAAPLPGSTRIVVVNDGSRDDTARVARARAGAARCPVELDRAAAQRRLRRGHERRPGRARADAAPTSSPASTPTGSTAPRRCRRCSTALRRARGSTCCRARASPRARRSSGGMPLYKYAANAALNRSRTARLGLRMTDYHSGYLRLRPPRAARAAVRAPVATASTSTSRSSPRRARAGSPSARRPCPRTTATRISHLQSDHLRPARAARAVALPTGALCSA